MHSYDLPDLTGHFTARAGDGHAPPLGSLGKIFSLTFILPSLPVIFPALNPIEPQHVGFQAPRLKLTLTNKYILELGNQGLGINPPLVVWETIEFFVDV